MAADRWGAKSTQEQKQQTPAQFEAAWQNVAAKALRGDGISTEAGLYFVRCGRRIAAATFCFGRLGHSAACSPTYANICDLPLPKDKRCIFSAGHKGRCLPVFPRG
jgi:hypothetical protein